MTLNGAIALILRYFTGFVYIVVFKQLLGLPRFQNLLFTARAMLSAVLGVVILSVSLSVHLSVRHTRAL